jgi:hypothetical protein
MQIHFAGYERHNQQNRNHPYSTAVRLLFAQFRTNEHFTIKIVAISGTIAAVLSEGVVESFGDF